MQKDQQLVRHSGNNHILIISVLIVTLTLIGKQCFHKMLWHTPTDHHTKFGYKRNLKQNEAQNPCAESTHKGIN